MSKLNAKEMKKWVKGVGKAKATSLIQQTLNCSESKAEKLSGCRYPSGLTFSEQKALSDLLKRPIEILFVNESKKVS